MEIHLKNFLSEENENYRIHKVPKEIYQKVSDMVDEQNKKQTEIILSEFWK